MNFQPRFLISWPRYSHEQRFQKQIWHCDISLKHLRSILVSPCYTGAVPALAGGLSEQNKHWWDRGLWLWPLRNIQQGQRSALTVHDELADVWLEIPTWNTCVPLYVSDFLCIPCHCLSSSHQKDSSSTQPSLNWSNFLSSFFTSSYFWDHSHLLSWCPDAFTHPNSTTEWPLLNVFSDLLDIR